MFYFMIVNTSLKVEASENEFSICERYSDTSSAVVKHAIMKTCALLH